MKPFILTCFFLCFSSVSTAKNLIYKKGKENSDNNYYPITHYFNAAFDVGQNPYFFSERGYFKNHKTVLKEVSTPHRSIMNDGGYGLFFQKEFYGENALPNVGLHLIGGGYDYRFLYEWYRAKGVRYPHTAAVITSYLGHLGNEAYEASNSKITSHDHIADLFFFDVVGKVLFMNDTIAEFLIDDMGVRPWHFMPTYDLADKKITNAGLNYIVRPKLFGERVLPFAYLGMQVLGGLSFRVLPKSYITTAFGLAIIEPFEKKYFYSGLFSYDIDGEPVAILNINGTEAYRYRLMLFPKYFEFYPKHRLGVILGSSRDNRPVFGVQFNLPLGIGSRVNK